MRLYKISLNGGSRPKSDIQVFALHVAFVLKQDISIVTNILMCRVNTTIL